MLFQHAKAKLHFVRLTPRIQRAVVGDERATNGDGLEAGGRAGRFVGLCRRMG